jgi:hypothetical protein
MFDAATFLEGLFRPADTGDLPLAPDIGPDDLPDDWRVEFEDRAAIKEYDGGLPRELAEAEALAEIVTQIKNRPPDAAGRAGISGIAPDYS